MRILIDCKNLGLYGAGISKWFEPLISGLISNRIDIDFLLVGPRFDTSFLPKLNNWKLATIDMPYWLPKPLRHPWYDNILFPLVTYKSKPDLVISPYHDVLMPKHIPSIITVHDLCLHELRDIYPFRIRNYYLSQLRRNLRRADVILTVSKDSLQKLETLYKVDSKKLRVVYNTFMPSPKNANEAGKLLQCLRSYEPGHRFIFYPGGCEYRKNTERLLKAFSVLCQKDTKLFLLITGNYNLSWEAQISRLQQELKNRIIFLGRLSDSEVYQVYRRSGAVLYPSLCEGFGRVCLEAMYAGTPIACSDLPVFREIAGDYPIYFDPYDVESIASAAADALTRCYQTGIEDDRFQSAKVIPNFINIAESLL